MVKHGVTIIAASDLPSQLSVHASHMWSRNMEKLLFHVTKDGALNLNLADEIVRGCLVTRDGEITHEGARTALAPHEGEAA